jgi:hypothetical protein
LVHVDQHFSGYFRHILFGLSLLPHVGKARPLNPDVMVNQNFKFPNPESHVILITKVGYAMGLVLFKLIFYTII